MAQTQHVGRIVLEGALLFTLRYDPPHRATSDPDPRCLSACDLAAVAQTAREMASFAEDDGVAFDPAMVTVDEGERARFVQPAHARLPAAQGPALRIATGQRPQSPSREPVKTPCS